MTCKDTASYGSSPPCMKCLIFLSLFPQKSHIISSSFAGKIATLSCFDIMCRNIGWWSGVGCLIFTNLFLQKSPIICGSFAERDLQLKLQDSFLFLACDKCMWKIPSARNPKSIWKTRSGNVWKLWVLFMDSAGTVLHQITQSYLYKPLSAKEPYNLWLFCGKRPAT